MQCTLETEAVIHMFCQFVCVLVLFKVIYFAFTYMYLCVCSCPCEPEMSESLKLGLQAVVNFLIYVLATKLWSPLRTVGSHNC